jgi:hypothetical protein
VTFRLANVWMLAQPYGYPSVLSSYAFSYPAQNSMGPPSDATGTRSRELRGKPGDGTVGQWVCEHRDPYLLRMVGFRRFVAGTDVNHWWDNGANAIAFSRGDKGFVAINRETSPVFATVATGLAAGTYCDLLTGGRVGAACAGTSVVVAAGGSVAAQLSPPTPPSPSTRGEALTANGIGITSPEEARSAPLRSVRRASAAVAPSPCALERKPSPVPGEGGWRRRRGLRAAVRGRRSAAGRVAQALGNSTSPGTGEVASPGEPERALSRITGTRARVARRDVDAAVGRGGAGARPPQRAARRVAEDRRRAAASPWSSAPSTTAWASATSCPDSPASATSR